MGRDAIFFEPGNYKAMAKAITFAYKNKKKLKTMAKNAKKQYEKISWPVMEKRLLKMYGNLKS